MSARSRLVRPKPSKSLKLEIDFSDPTHNALLKFFIEAIGVLKRMHDAADLMYKENGNKRIIILEDSSVGRISNRLEAEGRDLKDLYADLPLAVKEALAKHTGIKSGCEMAQYLLTDGYMFMAPKPLIYQSTGSGSHISYYYTANTATTVTSGIFDTYAV